LKKRSTSLGSLKRWASRALLKIEGARGALAIHRDVVGLASQGRQAAQLTHDAGLLLGDAETNYEAALASFDIWMAFKKRTIKLKLQAERKDQLRTWHLAPEKKRGPKPTEVKEYEVKEAVQRLKVYREWRELIATLKGLKVKADKAYFNPSDRRCHLIMNIGKLITRESPE
jgi:hypothetical protein